MVDIDQKVNQTSKEEEDGDMEKGWKGIDSNWKTESLDTFREEGPYPNTLVGCVPTLTGLEISAHPLLH
jgi:hypothetical protein